MKNRCGAVGILGRENGEPVFVVRALLTDIAYENLRLSLEPDLEVGERVPVSRLVSEHRGVVVLDETGQYVDEGEFGRAAEAELAFFSDHDDGLPVTDIRVLFGRTVQIKPELYDVIGARRRLKRFQRALGLG